MNFYVVIFLCFLLSVHGIRKKSLSLDGAIAAFVLGMIIFSHPDISWSLILLGFYFSGSLLTKYGAKTKKKYEESYVEGGQRNSIQVLANGLTGAIVSLIHRSSVNNYDLCQSFQDNIIHWVLFTAYLAHFACCSGDTWASEIGILSKDQPVLITTFRTVPRGTNGGVSTLGLMASISGGLFVGVIGVLPLIISNDCNTRINLGLFLICLSGICGLVGSLIDSLLGATLQKTVINTKTGKISTSIDNKSLKLQHVSGFEVLDNDQVNFISSLLTSAIMSAAVYLSLH